MEQQYTNELTPELATSLARPPFSAEKKAGISGGARQTGDEVVYPDGTTARIVTGSGSDFQKGGKSIALVGSRLSNGDVIISTPQAGCTLNELKGLPMDADFLPAEG
ncbi:MAG: hypothetical protein H6R25_2156 [Proteobacteria bacterium]|nr:hypothetical protein [Pseudomonadota bacterium]